ncbi:NAD-specific glutamate dehydrogenase [Cytospora mali]|uniref:NAD-specific glutamate dehydrogenase n=1 Tax=Cytospora mali TaxID=578113 RepID=A0A194VTH1_CYTMA|nr:NAD-specific glutamate dehydrogenase [Valsa mali]
MGWFWQDSAKTAKPSTSQTAPSQSTAQAPSQPPQDQNDTSSSPDVDPEVRRFLEDLMGELKGTGSSGSDQQPPPEPSPADPALGSSSPPPASQSSSSIPWSSWFSRSSTPADPSSGSTPNTHTDTPSRRADQQVEASSPPTEERLSPLAESLLPTTMDCEQAFNQAFYCQSLGGQWNNIYRYGNVRPCSENWDDFWFCMRVKGYAAGKVKDDMIREHYRKKHLAKYGSGKPNSEDVWKERKERLPPGTAFVEPAEAPTVSDAEYQSNLVDLLDGGAVIATSAGSTAGTREATRSTAGHAAGSATGTVELHHDGVGDSLKLLLLSLVLLLSCLLALVQPGDSLVNLGLELLLVGSIKLLVDLGVGEGVAQGVSVGLETVLGSDTLGLKLILLLELLGLSQHALDLLLGQAALVVGDDDLVGLAGTLLKGGDVHDTVGINIEGDLDLRNTTGCGGNAGKLELAEQVVVLGALTLTLVDLDEDTRLVVGEGREDLGLLGGNGGVARDELGHHTTSGLNTQRQRCDIQKQDLVGGLGAGVTRQDGGLDGGTVGNSLIGVDGLVGLLAVEVVRDQLLDTGDTGRTSDQDDLVDLRLVDLGVGQDTVNGLQGRAEEVLAELLETSTGDGGVEVNTLKQGVDLDGSLSGRGQSSLSTLASSAETTQSTRVGAQVLLEFPFEFVYKVVDETVVEVLTTQMSVTGGRLDLEDTLLDGQQGHIEGTTTQIEDEDVALALDLLVETVSDSGSGRLVDDTENVQASNETGVLGGLTLRVVEVGRNGDDSVVNGATQVCLSGLTHLGQDHRGDLLGGEVLGLALELDLNDRLTSLVDNLEGEVLHVGLNLRVDKLATNQPLRVEDGVVGVHSDLVLGGISDQTLGVGESDERGCCAVTLVVGDAGMIVVPKSIPTAGAIVKD